MFEKMDVDSERIVSDALRTTREGNITSDLMQIDSHDPRVGINEMPTIGSGAYGKPRTGKVRSVGSKTKGDHLHKVYTVPRERYDDQKTQDPLGH